MTQHFTKHNNRLPAQNCTVVKLIYRVMIIQPGRLARNSGCDAFISVCIATYRYFLVNLLGVSSDAAADFLAMVIVVVVYLAKSHCCKLRAQA